MVLQWVITTMVNSAEILLHEDGSFEMIRRAETPRDYFATFDCFPVFEKLLQDEDELK
jgi:diaminopimelate decarboxylase